MNKTTDPLMIHVRREMDRLGFRLAGQNLALNWSRYSPEVRAKVAKRWGVEQ